MERFFHCWVCGFLIDLAHDSAAAFESNKWAHTVCFERIKNFWNECREYPPEIHHPTM
jgi:hypothetical protein